MHHVCASLVNSHIVGDSLDIGPYDYQSAISELLSFCLEELEYTDSIDCSYKKHPLHPSSSIVSYRQLGFLLDYTDPKTINYIARVGPPRTSFSQLGSYTQEIFLSGKDKKTFLDTYVTKEGRFIDVLECVDNLGYSHYYYLSYLFGHIDADDEEEDDDALLFATIPTFVSQDAKHLKPPANADLVFLDIDQVKTAIVDKKKYVFLV